MDATLSGTRAKPFVKWAGGKTQLLEEIDRRLPAELREGRIDTYVEPFVGGGAVFFHIAQNYPGIRRFYLFDINEDLVNCYNAIKTMPGAVIRDLRELAGEFHSRVGSKRKEFYYHVREVFNSDRSPTKLMFLNRTCFNGLYRVNKSGGFNVPFGDYKNPTICHEANIRAVSVLLERAEIIHGHFADSQRLARRGSFFYFDPPYRPLSPTAGFTSYSKEDFSERDQIELSELCRRIDEKGCKFLLSNSDPKNEKPDDDFFEEHYGDFTIERVKAVRAINCKGARRGAISELIITN